MILTAPIIEKRGQEKFVVIPYNEFKVMRQHLEDYEDLCIIREEKAAATREKSRSLDDILKEIEN